MNYSTLALIIYINLARITSSDPECKVFKDKFEINGLVEKNDNKLQFSGTVNLYPGTADIEIQLRYTDTEYFYDPKYKGLTKEDGIDNELTCLDLKFLKFPDNTFNEANQEEIIDLTPVASSNESTRWRYLTYTIPGDQLKTRLVASESTINYVYTGYYAIAYYIQTVVEFTYQFQFSVTVNKVVDAGMDSSFLPYPFNERCKTEEPCQIKSQSSVSFCTNSTCVETTESLEIYMNDYFWIIQKITTPGLTQYYLSDTKISFVGDGLNKYATIEATDYKTVGQATYRLKASIVWTKLRIQVNSVMKTTASSEDDETTLTIDGKSIEFCIFVEESTECPTCDEIIANNPDGLGPAECNSTLAKILLQIGLAFISFLF